MEGPQNSTVLMSPYRVGKGASNGGVFMLGLGYSLRSYTGHQMFRTLTAPTDWELPADVVMRYVGTRATKLSYARMTQHHAHGRRTQRARQACCHITLAEFLVPSLRYTPHALDELLVSLVQKNGPVRRNFCATWHVNAPQDVECPDW